MDVSVIIVNYHTSRLALRAIDSLTRFVKGVSYEVIVVDNASEPDFGDTLRGRYGGLVSFIALPANAGFGRANNAALPLAKGRNVLFLNPDTELLNDAVSLLSDYLDAHPDVGGAGGNLYTPEGAPMHSHMLLYPSLKWDLITLGGNRAERWFIGKNAQFNYTEAPLEVAYVTGADLMIPRRVLDDVGAFDPDFFMYCEETDLCYRIHKAGYKLRNIPASRICHLEGATFTANDPRERMKAASRRLYERKHLSVCERGLCKAVRRTNAAARCLVFRLLGRKEKYDYWRCILRYA